MKESLIFFPKDCSQALALLNDYEIEADIKENFIIICPCIELKNNIQMLQNNKNVYNIIGYCPIFYHIHNKRFLHSFSKYYGIVDSCDELIEKIFKLNNIFYFRKKQIYEIDNNSELIETKLERNILIDLHNNCSKSHVIGEKLDKYYEYKVNNDNLYFAFIKSLTLLNKCLEDKNYNLLFNIIGNLGDLVILSDNPMENILFSSICFKNLHILYLYFSNYPYFYGKLSDEEINKILSNFNYNLDKNELKSNIISGFNSLVTIVDTLAFKVIKGLNILNENEKLKLLHKFLIEVNCSIEQSLQNKNIEKLSEFYKIKIFLEILILV